MRLSPVNVREWYTIGIYSSIEATEWEERGGGGVKGFIAMATGLHVE